MDENKDKNKMEDLEVSGDLEVKGELKVGGETKKEPRITMEDVEQETKEEYCLPLVAMGVKGADSRCMGSKCKCFWDAKNEACLINLALQTYAVKGNWDLMLDVSTKLDPQGRRVARTEGDLTTLKGIFEKFKGVFGI